MENGIFTAEQYHEALRHYEAVSAELATLAEHFSNQADRITLERAAVLLRSLADSGKEYKPLLYRN